MKRILVLFCVVVVLLSLTGSTVLGGRLAGTLVVSPSGLVQNGTSVMFTYATANLTRTQAEYIYIACYWSGPSAGSVSDVLEGSSPLTWLVDLPLSHNQGAECYAILTVSQEKDHGDVHYYQLDRVDWVVE